MAGALDQLVDDSTTFGNDGSRAALRVNPLGILIDPEMVKDRGREVGWPDSPAFDVVTFSIGAADDLTMAQTAACDDHGHLALPVVSTRLGVDYRAPAELTHGASSPREADRLQRD